MPDDWEISTSEPLWVLFNAPWHRATLNVFSGAGAKNPPDDVEDLANGSLNRMRDEPGFELDALEVVSDTVARARYRYSWDIGFCNDLESYGLYILQSVRLFIIQMDVCADWTDQYDDAFVERVFDSLIYTNQRR